MSKVSIIKVNENLGAAIRQALDGLGGWGAFVGQGERVMLKPNFNTADTYPGSSDPDFLREVAKQILALDPEEIMIGDSSTMMAKTEKVMKEIGVYELEKLDKRIKVVNFDKGKWLKKEIPGGKFLKTVSLPESMERTDKLILLPCLKTHFLAQYTGALKLGVGLMKPRERTPLHLNHLQEKIADLNLAFRSDLVIMDARTCFISGGPMKGPREHPGLILASSGRTAIDLAGVRIIREYENNSLSDLQAEEIPQIKRAIELGIQ